MDEDSDGERLDSFLAEQLSPSRSRLKKLISAGHCSLNGGPVTKPSRKLVEHDRVTLDMPGEAEIFIEPQQIDLDVTYEDSEVAVINKPTGMVIHPSKGHAHDTLVNALLHRYGQLPAGDEPRRPGIAHRIDRDTSGLIVIARTPEALEHLQEQFREHTIEREYLGIAVSVGAPGLREGGDTIRSSHGRHPYKRMRFTGDEGTREAVTHYEVLETFNHGAALVRCRLETGRTHQIRMHLSELGVPLLGDALYGGASVGGTGVIKRIALHAAVLGFIHPTTGVSMRFEAPLTSDFELALVRLRSGDGWV